MRIGYAIESDERDSICFSVNFDYKSINEDDKQFKCIKSDLEQFKWFKNIITHMSNVLKICTEFTVFSSKKEIEDAREIIKSIIAECYDEIADNI